eukprot:jgi/Astpho2/8644/Aster-05119
MLLGKEIVVWRDAQQQWRAFEDLCPHRKVLLSEGRVHQEEGTLECAYHGWQFGSDGRAVKIPQLGYDNPKAEAAACATQRACVSSYPCQVRQDLVWVWPDESREAPHEAAAQAPTISPFLESLPEEARRFSFDHFVRDLPGSFDVWTENMCDQSHVPFAHHAVAGDRNGEGAGLFNYLGGSEGSTAKDGLQFTFQWSSGKSVEGLKTTFTYLPPSYNGFTGAGPFSLYIYAVPTSTNATRLIITAASDRRARKAALPIRIMEALGLTRLIGHWTLNRVTDGDIVFMHKQHSHNASRGMGKDPRDWARNYYMVAGSDRGVSLFRRWLSTKGQGGPQYADAGHVENFRDHMGRLDRRALLDRHAQHTAHCSTCSKASQVVARSQVVAGVVAVVMLLGLAYSLGHGAELISVPAIALALASLLGAGAAIGLGRVQKEFGFKDWQHSKL